MTSGSYKFDDGHKNPTKCFPGRTLLRRKKEGAAHWLVAYREAEEQKYKTLHRKIKETFKECERSGAFGSPHVKTLDGPFLLQLHCVDKPSELCNVDISEQKLNSVKPEDLTVFDNVAYVDASINSLSLGPFGSFVSLRELNLSLNGLCNVKFNVADFPHLQVLDLSYNNLSADDVVSFARLPHLKVLHLTGNQLHHLPPRLGSSDHDPAQPLAEEDTQFRALEVLMLDDNKLTSGVFNCLANLKRLKYLNLQGNCISEVPYLQVMGCSEPLQTSAEEQAEAEALSEPNLNPDECFKLVSQFFWIKEGLKGSRSPLPELQVLILSDNKIAEEGALLAVALCPMLHEIDIRSNPLTTQRSGDPPMLTHYLQERLGIIIKRKNEPEVKPPLRLSANPHWKVEERTLKKPSLMEKLSPALTKVDECEVNTAPGSKGKNNADETSQGITEHLFVTQAADIPEHDFYLQTCEEETSQNKETHEDEAVPESFSFYETLMDAKPNPDVLEPVGIQTAVRMLEHTLKNLSVYRDSKPKHDRIQTPYAGRQKRIKALPRLRPIKQQTERVDAVIKDIKESTTIKGSSLSSVIHGTHVNEQEYTEALRLLKDLKTKYRMVHKTTMEQEGSVESDRNNDQDKDEHPTL